jgi:uncharacterized protein (TIGR00251 family)
MGAEKFLKNSVDGGSLKIIVKANAAKTEIISFDEARRALRVNVHAPPRDNEANLEIIKYFSKLLKKKVTIKTGQKSKEKLLILK